MPKGQLKLTAALAGLVVLVVLVWGTVAERGLRRAEIERIARSLEARAALVGQVAADVVFEPASAAALDAIADRAAEASGARVTLIARDGAVVGDSDVALARLSAMETHADRPEVRAALEGAVGRSTRRSATVGRSLLYLAVPHGEGGVVRLAIDLSDLEAAVSNLRRELLAAGAFALVAALALSYAFTWLTLRRVRDMGEVASAIAEGHLDGRLPLRRGDELGDISAAINRMAEQLRLRLEEALREKEQLDAVLEAMVEGVLAVDAKGVVLLANSRVRELYGIKEELVGRPLLGTIRDAELDDVLAEAAHSDETVSRALTVGHPVERILRVQAVRFPKSGSRVGTVVAIHDISELMRLEGVRRDFVANASHELRTPLAAIRGYAETLLADDSAEATVRRSYLEVIDRHAQRLGNLVDDLLTLSAIERGTQNLDLGPVDVGAVTQRVAREWDARFREQSLDVRTHFEDGCVAWADEGALEQILTNLLDNAAKYTDAGGSIELSVVGEDDLVRVRVRDSGIGIPERDLGRIFERFYRVDKARSSAQGGTGLGLSIVRHLVQSFDGEIHVESDPGSGSTFSFELPRASAGDRGTG